MADTIREIIMKQLQTVLRSITVSNGYENTFQPEAVQRFTQGGIVTSVKPYVVIIEEDDTASDDVTMVPYGLTLHDLKITLAVITSQDTSIDPRSSEEVCNSLRGDLVRALQAENVRSWVIEGTAHAVKTDPLSFSTIYAMIGEPELEFHATTTITYRHRSTDPMALT